jgi:hypothetical protein
VSSVWLTSPRMVSIASMFPTMSSRLNDDKVFCHSIILLTSRCWSLISP